MADVVPQIEVQATGASRKAQAGDALVAEDGTALTVAGAPAAHAASHVAADAIQNATAAQSGLATAPQITKLDGIEALATADQTAAEIEAIVNHNNLLGVVVGQHRVINDGGTSATELWSAQKISQDLAAATANLDIKDSVVTVAVANVVLSGEQTLEGILTSTSRVGVTGQTAGAENGIYVTAAGAWARAADADVSAEVTQGLSFFVASGTKQGFQYILTTAGAITLGTTALGFVEVKRVEFGTAAGTATEGNDARVPTQNENDALVGTSGAPSTANKYVTDADVRVTTAVPDTLFSANSVLKADVNNTPLALTVGEQTMLGRITAGVIAALTPAQIRTLLNVADGANAYVHPNHSGDVTSVADGATTIANNAVTLAKMADMATASILGRDTAATGDPEVLTAAQARGIVSPLTTKGDLWAFGTADARLAIGSNTQVLTADSTVAEGFKWAAGGGGGGGGGFELIEGKAGTGTSLTITVPANTLTVDGHHLYIEALYEAAVVTGFPRIKWGALTVDSALGFPAGEYVRFFCRVTRTGAASQQVTVHTRHHQASGTSASIEGMGRTATETLSGTVAVVADWIVAGSQKIISLKVWKAIL